MFVQNVAILHGSHCDMILPKGTSPNTSPPGAQLAVAWLNCYRLRLTNTAATKKKSYEMSISTDMGHEWKNCTQLVYDSHFIISFRPLYGIRYHPWLGKSNNDHLTSIVSPYLLDVDVSSYWSLPVNVPSAILLWVYNKCLTKPTSRVVTLIFFNKDVSKESAQGWGVDQDGSSDYPMQSQKMAINPINHHLNSWNYRRK